MSRFGEIYERARPLIIWLVLGELAWTGFWLLDFADTTPGYLVTAVAWLVLMLAWMTLVTYLGNRGVFLRHTRWLSNLAGFAHIRYYAEDLGGGAFATGGPTDHVREVSGRAPEDFESIARRYIQNPALIHPTLRIGSKLEAIGFLGKMLATRAPDLGAWERDRGYPLLDNPVPSYDSAEWRATAERQQLNLLAGPQSVAPVREMIA